MGRKSWEQHKQVGGLFDQVLLPKATHTDVLKVLTISPHCADGERGAPCTQNRLVQNVHRDTGSILQRGLKLG